jgi:hypothetical protein
MANRPNHEKNCTTASCAWSGMRKASSRTSEKPLGYGRPLEARADDARDAEHRQQAGQHIEFLLQPVVQTSTAKANPLSKPPKPRA